MAECQPCAGAPRHTEQFAKILAALSGEIAKRSLAGIDEGELSLSLAVLVADALDIDIYQ